MTDDVTPADGPPTCLSCAHSGTPRPHTYLLGCGKRLVIVTPGPECVCDDYEPEGEDA